MQGLNRKIGGEGGRGIGGPMLLGALMVGLLLPVGAYFRMKQGETPVSEAVASGSLKPWSVDKRGDGLAITWDRDSDRFPSANEVVLAVRDGAETKEIDLVARKGTMFYTPRNSDVELRLKLARGAGLTTDVALFRGSVAPSPVAQAPPAVAQTPSAAAPPPVETQLPSAVEETKPAVQEKKPEMAESGGRIVGDPGELARSTAKVVAPVETAAVKPPIEVVAEPKPRQAKEAPGPRFNAIAIRRVFPVVPLSLIAARREKGAAAVEIPVRITVGSTGRVIAAVAAEQSDPLNQQLARLAEDAARQWRFQPAPGGQAKALSIQTVRFSFPAAR